MAPPDRTVLMFLYSELVVELALGDGTRGECVSGQLEALLEVPLIYYQSWLD